MGRIAISFVGRAEADDGFAIHQNRTLGLFGLGQRAVDIFGIVAVAMQHRPAGCRKAGALVCLIGNRDAAIDGDVIVVPQNNEVRELLHPRKADGLLADAFHQAAVATNHPSAVIDDALAETRLQRLLCHREANRIGDPLAERAGGCLNRVHKEVFGVASRQRAHLAEVLDLVERDLLVADKIEQRVDQHRAMAGRQDEPVAVGPFRRGGVKFQVVAEQHSGDIGHAHRHARVAGVRRLHGVHRKGADRGSELPMVGVLGAERCDIQGLFLFVNRCAIGRVFAVTAMIAAALIAGCGPRSSVPPKWLIEKGGRRLANCVN